jgi:hypothetical protein
MMGEDDEYAYLQALKDASEALRHRLAQRVAQLEEPDIEIVLLEIRRQLAESAVEGDTTRAGDLSSLVLDLITAREESRRL